MNAATHTPGPWAVCGEAPNPAWSVGRTIYSVPEQSRVADVSILRNDSMALADARLIAAAPDMLLALVMVIDTIGFKFMEQQIQDMVSDAIAKATGEAA